MIKTYILIVSLFISLSASGQDNNKELQNVTTCIENYFYGYVERDIEKLNLAFDTLHGTMKAPGGNNNGTEAYKNLYFKDLIPKWGNRDKLSAKELADTELQILNIDIYDSQMATGKISMRVGDTTYIDILSLQKLNGLWKITNKIFLTYKE